MLALALPSIVERAFAFPALLHVPHHLLATPQMSRATAEMVVALLTRHVHLLNVDDEGDSAADWRAPVGPPLPPPPAALIAPPPPAAAASSAAAAGPSAKQQQQLHGASNADPQRPATWHLAALARPGQRGTGTAGAPTGSSTAAAAASRGSGGSSRAATAAAAAASASASSDALRPLGAGVWAFNEDGEFDALLRSAADAPPPDHELPLLLARLDDAAAVVAGSSSGSGGSGEWSAASLLASVGPPPSTRSDRATAWLRLMKYTIIALCTAPDAATAAAGDPIVILCMYVAPLVRATLRNLALCRHPVHHVYLLRTLLRVVTTASARTERDGAIALHVELAPVMPALLDALMRLHAGSADAGLRDSALELCITLPLRLAMQLPFLGRLLRPVALALRARDDRKGLAGMALKTLEFFVDNLSPGYLCAVLDADPPLHVDLMAALTGLLRPQPAPHGLDALRVLGKLGGRARRWMAAPPQLPRLASIVAPAIATGAGGGPWRSSGGGVPAAGLAFPGLTLRVRWNASLPGSLYTPPEDPAEHDLLAQVGTVRGGEGRGRTPRSTTSSRRRVR